MKKKNIDKRMDRVEKLHNHIKNYTHKNNITIIELYAVLKDMIEQIEDGIPEIKNKWIETKKER